MTRRIPVLCLLVFLVSCEKKTKENQPSTQPANVSAPEAPHTGIPIVRIELAGEFLDAFNETKECSGIMLLPQDRNTPADFRAQTSLGTADTPEKEEEWRWTLFDLWHDPKGEFRGAGNQTSAANAMKDMCTSIWHAFDSVRQSGQSGH
jgi:hypothetical protein